MLSLIAGYAFAELDVSAAIWVSGDFWYPLYSTPNVGDLEYEHGVASRRWAYNGKNLSAAGRELRAVRGEHAGVCDMFVPLSKGGERGGILVAGPFATSRPTSAEVLSRWRTITGREGRLEDASFSQYVTRTLSTLTLEGPRVRCFERLLTCLADLAADHGERDALAKEIDAARKALEVVRYPERVWKTARLLVDERSNVTWAEHGGMELARLGMLELPRHVVVGIAAGREREADLLDERLRRDAFVRACVDLGRRFGQALSVPVGEQGVAFLVERTSAKASARASLIELVTKAAALARRHGLRLCAGICQATDAPTLAARYRAALYGAERALAKGALFIDGEPIAARSAGELRDLRADLGQPLRERPSLLLARFERYVEAVLAATSYRLEPTRVELGAGLERVTEALVASGFMDRKSRDELFAAVDRGVKDVTTANDLLALYRRIVNEALSALREPTRARQERSTSRARMFMEDHLDERLTLERVAKIAGFAPDYFSRLLKREHGVSFEQYLSRLRIERSKLLLIGTRLDVDSIRTLTGFRSRNYFHRVFKGTVGTTPAAFRERRT
jgi:AraC-like DNA-binding protein